MRAAALLVLLALGCGAKTAPQGPDRDAGDFDAAPPECVRDSQCDDGIECTEERCEARRCVRVERDERCQDDLFCTSSDRCELGVGCVRDDNPCSDGVECTEDTCDERRRQCVHEPRFDRCPLSNRCDPVAGCVARALVHDPDALYEVDLPGGEVRMLARSEISLTDLALHPDGTAYAINRTTLFELDQATGQVRFIATLDDANVALDVSPDGELLTAGDTAVSRVDRATGASAPFAFFPPGLFASGDIAFVRDRMLVTATDTPAFALGSNDALMEVPSGGGRLTVVGGIGFPCVWGLAPFGDTLFGFTCQGLLLEIDPETGAGRQLATLRGLELGGAAAR